MYNHYTSNPIKLQQFLVFYKRIWQNIRCSYKILPYIHVLRFMQVCLKQESNTKRSVLSYILNGYYSLSVASCMCRHRNFRGKVFGRSITSLKFSVRISIIFITSQTRSSMSVLPISMAFVAVVFDLDLRLYCEPFNFGETDEVT